MTAKIFLQFVTDSSVQLSAQPPTAAYIIWKNPYMTVGTDTFIHSMLKLAGFENIITDQTRYPEISIAELQHLRPGYVMLSSEPFPFRQDDVHHLEDLLPHSKIILVDGEMFSWYGSRLLLSAEYFRQLKEQV